MKIGLENFEGLITGQTVYFTRMRKPFVPGAAVVICFQEHSIRPGSLFPRVRMVERPEEEYIIIHSNQLTLRDRFKPIKRRAAAGKKTTPKRRLTRREI